MNYHKSIELHRADKDRFFKSHHQSPLDHNIRDKFIHLDYFPIDKGWKFTLPLQRYDDVISITMEMSTEGEQEYLRIGFLEFNHPDTGDKVKLNVYKSTSSGHMTVMFRDATSGEETYGAGRYLELEKDGDNFILDFNLAYSPFCAYSDYYACPIPPFENWLQVPILAGEKDFQLKKH